MGKGIGCEVGEEEQMDKRSIVVLMIAAAIFLGGYMVGEVARIDHSKYQVWTSVESQRWQRMWLVERCSRPVGIVVGAGGALWLITSTLQSRKKD